jgi:hypothetical protein
VIRVIQVAIGDQRQMGADPIQRRVQDPGPLVRGHGHVEHSPLSGPLLGSVSQPAK